MKNLQVNSLLSTHIMMCLTMCIMLMTTARAGFLPPPLRLVSFNAKNVENAVLLEWRTLGENNTDYFSIEQSTDGLTFKKVGSMKAAGVDPLNRYYSYSDAWPTAGNNYYRLSMYDLDGTVKYSATQVIKAEGIRRVRISPNPVMNTSKISVRWASVAAGNAAVNIYELNGKLVFKGRLDISGRTVIQIQNWPAGIYNLSIDNGMRKEVSKLVVF